MTIAAGLNKQLIYKIETTYGTAAGQASGQRMRRVESSIDLAKETYESNEKRDDLQVGDYRHGVRSITGSINGELSALSYAPLFAMLLKRDFSAIAASTAMSITVAGTAPTYTVTRAAGSWLSDGYKVGMVGRLTGGSLNALNTAKNLLITDLTATIMTVMTLNGSSMQAEGPIATVTFTLAGKQTYVPITGHTDKSMSIEHYYSDLAESELFLGCKIKKASLSLPPTGIATVGFDVGGQDLADTSAKRGGIATTTAYFTSPTAMATTGTLAAVNGILRVGGATVATVTGLTIDIEAQYGGKAVVGRNTIPGQFPGKLRVSGQATVYFESVALRNAFVNETAIDLIAAFTADNSDAADFISFTIPNIKVGGAQKNDPEGDGIEQTLPFMALLNGSGGTGVKTEKTTIQMQDSQAA